MQFHYQARDESGRIRVGEISAASSEEASQQIRQDGLYLLSVEEIVESPPAALPVLFQKRVSRLEIIYLTNQLAIMVDAGVPVADALSGLARQNGNPTLQNILEQIHKRVEAGDDLSLALSRFPKQFDKTFVNLVKASEAGGTLGHMLNRIALQASNELETKQKVRGALMYPAAMLLLCVAVCIFLLTYVFPKLMPMFAARNIEVPTPTRVMMVMSEALTHHWYWFLIGGAAVVWFLVYARKQDWGRAALDWLWLHLPILGPLLRKVSLSRSLRTLSTTINAGVPMLEALQLGAGVANNVFYERSWRKVADEVAGGKQIHEALEGDPLFPSTLLQMISSGEATGKLGPVLNKVCDYFDKDVANSVKSATSLIEPIMVTVMGSVIGTIALAMLLPIFKLSSHTG